MAEKIGIQSVSDVITSKAGREYFTLEDMAQKRYVCFISKLNHFCQVGGEIEADVTPGKTESDSPRIDMIYVNGKPVISVEKKETGRSYGKSDKELTQQRQLAEAQNRSIQAQTALNRAVDLTIAYINATQKGVEYDGIAKVAREFYQLLQSLTQISEAEVIHQKIKEAKSETVKATIQTAPGKEVFQEEKVEVLGERELTLGYVKALVEKDGRDFKEWIAEVANLFSVPLSGKTPRQIWELLDDSQKKLAIGGLK